MDSKDYNYFESLVNNSLFAVLDIETTGFSPRKGDKIVEIAIITIDLQGNVVDTYETLINPNREVSASHIHRITSEMVKNAPTIDEIMDDIIYHLNNKTIVGHNIAFDLRFINYELAKYTGTNLNLEGICTIEMSKQVISGLPARRLETFCDYFDIEESDAHSAYGDCYATMELFKIFKGILLDEITIDEFIHFYSKSVLIASNVTPKNICFKRGDAIEMKRREQDRLTNMIKRLPSDPNYSIPVQQYLNLLDGILADRLITESEIRELYHFMYEFNISQKQVDEIHSEYIRKLVRVYLLDEFLSPSEKNDLKNVCELLCINEDEVYKIIEFERAKIAKQRVNNADGCLADIVGKSVCFTGQLLSQLDGHPIDRASAQELAIERGLIVKSGISKNLDFLVVADPNSLSGKARKAREIGIKLIAEPVFWNMIGIAVE
ncbi:MAG: hypothetical protein JEZ03_08020 [Bacteroidales bacterium]|nr:hypothetical protein [Bacteroidales bacterium]